MPAETELRVAVELTNIQQLRRVTQELRRIGQADEGFENVNREAEEAGQEIEQMGRFAQFTLDVLEAFLLYKGFVFLKTQAQEFTRELVNLENQVAIIQTQLGDVDTDFEPQIRSQLIETAEETGKSLESLADAEFSLVSANIELQDSFQVLNQVTKAATAGGLNDVNVAVQSVLTQMNAFGIEAEDTNKILDKQFNLLKRGIFTYEQFARVSGTVSTAFAGIGQDIETANAALATVSQIFTGPQLRRGATGLRNVANAIGTNSEQFEELGVAVFDKEGNFRNFIDIIRDLKEEMRGMSEEQQFQALQQVFPDKRELRGARALLERLPQMEEFFIEQQFAAGDLDEAYDNVSESIKVQAGVLKNEMVPAFEPVLLLFDDLLSVVNTLDDAIPGFTRSLLSMAAALASVKAAGLASRQAGGMGVATGAAAGSLFSKRPTGLGLAVGAGVGATILETGRKAEPGVDEGGLLSSIGGGAATGAVLGGGVPGALAGAAAGAGLFAIGEAMEGEAKATAEAWNKRFKAGVLEEGKTIGQSLSNVVAEEIEGEAGQNVSERVRETIEGPLEFTDTDRQVVLRRGFGGGLENLFNNLRRGLIPGSDAGTRTRVRTQEVDLRRAIINSIEKAEQQRTKIRALEAEGEGSFETIRGQVIETAFENFVQGLGDVDDQHQKRIETARNLVQILSEQGVSAEKASDALDTLESDGLGPFLDQLEGAAVADLPQFRETIADFRNRMTFEVEEISSALDELNLSSSSLGQEFEQLGRTMRALEITELFQEQGLISEDQAAVLSARTLFESGFGFQGGGLPGQMDDVQFNNLLMRMQKFVEGGLEEEDPEEALERFGLSTISAADTMEQAQANIDEGLFQPIELAGESIGTFAQEFKEFNQRIQAIQLIEEILGLQDALDLSQGQVDNLNQAIVQLAEDAMSGADTGFFEGSPEDIADRVFELVQASQVEAGEEEDPLDVPGKTQLDQALRDTAKSMERGLISSANFTSTQLRTMGDDIAVLNKQLRKVALLEEIGRVAELAGESVNLTSTIQTLVQDLTIGGQTLSQLISDPEKLADLIATAEFREVNIDKSDRRSFVIRVSEATNPQQATEIADQILREVNNKVQKEVPS